MKCMRTILLLVLAASMCTSASPQGKPNANPETEILWDTWGVPHIFAKDEAGAFQAFGWAQMHSHGKLLLQLLAQGRGRAAEYYGHPLLVSDRTVHTLGIYETARKWHAQQIPAFRRNIDAFAAGINEYARQHPEELDPVAKSILPVNGVDVLAHTTRVLADFVTMTAGCFGSLPDGSLPGSNAWAIGPSHSENGHAMLLANPHLPWSSEFTFFEAQLSAPGYDAYGTTLVGFPVLVIAFNDTHGWSHTVNTIDACDVYALTREKNGYLFDGAARAFDQETRMIRVKQEDGSLKDAPLVVRRSAPGPVVEKDGKLLAIHIAGLQAGSYAGALEEWWEMGRARNFAQFQAALRRMQLPMFNVIYADHAGHIELLYNGLVPVRPTGTVQSWLGVMPGDRSSLVWNKFHSYEELPKAIDPPAGWVQNSNSAPWYMTEPFLNPDRYPANLSAGWSDPFGAPSLREQRGLRMLKQDAKMSYRQLLTDKYSTRSELADRILDDLVRAAKQSGDSSAQQAAAVLEKWDRETNADSKGAFLFAFWAQTAWKESQGHLFAEPFDPTRPLDTPRGLKDPQAAVSSLISTAAQLRNAIGPIDVSWGEVNRLRRGKFVFPGNGGPSALGIFRVMDYAPEGHAILPGGDSLVLPGKDRHLDSLGGDTFVAALEFSSPLKARVLLTYGNTSDPGSSHFGDQIPLAAGKEWREPWRTRAEIEQHLETHTVFHSNGSVTSTVPKQD